MCTITSAAPLLLNHLSPPPKGWCPWNTIISQAACCDHIFAKMRLKVRTEGYGSSPAFLQYSFLIVQTFSVLLLSLSSNPTKPTKTVFLPCSSSTQWSFVLFSFPVLTHPSLSHIRSWKSALRVQKMMLLLHPWPQATIFLQVLLNV